MYLITSSYNIQEEILSPTMTLNLMTKYPSKSETQLYFTVKFSKIRLLSLYFGQLHNFQEINDCILFPW